MNDPDPLSSRIQDMPYDQRPREKLASLGPAALDNAELMALFISTGMKGRSAIEIGRELIAKYGSMAALGGLPVAELSKIKGLGLAKASKLAAAFELGTRVAREQLRDVSLETPELIHNFFGPQLRHLSQEQVMVAVLDSRLRHMATTVVSVGTVNDSSAHPREILRPVITRGAYGFILTRRVIDAAKLMQVCFLDHVIIGKPSPGRAPYYSFREAGVVP
jgi:DNA repair protein RadC